MLSNGNLHSFTLTTRSVRLGGNNNMTQEEIDNNNMIKAFVGDAIPLFDANGFNYAWRKVYGETHIDMNYSELNYHSSYDAIMSVVEKIEAMGYVFEVRRKTCEIATFEKESEVLFLLHSETKIGAIYSAIIQFITWHNSQK